MGIDDKGLDEAKDSLNKLAKGIDPQELSHWAKRIEKIAKQLCNDRLSDLTLRSHDKELDLSAKDRKTADCLIKAIETNIPSMPLFMQGVFSKLASDLREAKFNS
jgi:hypothetical protein